MDLTAGAGAPSARASTKPTDSRLGQRLRSFLPRPGQGGDPVSELLRAHRHIHPRSDLGLVRKGYKVAEQMHRGQFRKSGDAYITHPLAVARILADLGMDTTTLVAALLHDTVEDTSYTLGKLSEEFGPEVALLVDGVTKFDKVYFGNIAEAETIRKMLLRAGQDVRVLVIKLADRVHNMRTLDARSTASRRRIAGTTKDVLVPLCDRLGIQVLKRELEDMVLWALESEWYSTIDSHVKNRPDRTAFLSQVTRTLQAGLGRAKVDAKISERPRHYYSIWKDTVALHGRALRDGPKARRDPSKLLRDLPRIVIVVDGQRTDCYSALGVVHTTWRPVPGRFKDFIASPKNNLYRSLHTTVLGPNDQPLEVLIRTEPMHRSAEYGIVANFRYPDHLARLSPQAREEQLTWLRRVLDWEDVADGAESFHALLTRQLAAIPDGPDKTLGLSIGAESATRLLAERADDGAANAEGPYQPGRKPGSYQFTPPFNAPPFNGYATYPKLGQVRPFALRSADQFRAPPPYTVLDPEYAFEYNEVRVMGAEHSSVRTADQTDAARFWYEMSAFGWNRLARLLSARRNDSLLERARLFAVLDAAMIDAFIASFESKYAYNFWRPLTAIQQAGTDGNPFTTPEPGWHPLMHTPPMPDYISTHAAQGGAAATVLIRFFGDEQVFTLPTTMTAQYPDLQPRTFQRISDAAVENALSRLYAGIHFRFACLTGLKQGREVGAWVVAQAPFAPR